ncbi:MAG TPA: pantoate--beta-alanine ligase [Candidatus Cybelea sp.]|nr:pantoate--beta-alanine ligase [Candidatus Cybelea sp.]
METIHTIEWMKQTAREARGRERLIGFLPTMGALHEGHLCLVREAQRRCSPVVVSIFVNPKQFGPSEDLENYPRNFERDRSMLEEMRVDYLFAPSPAEMYPSGFQTMVSVEGLSERLEGRSRPGHFRGVTTVVLKLFEIVQPHFAFFGRKDAQQAQIVRQMTRDLALDTEIVVGPLVREADGLAISSRNVYLKPDERKAATVLCRSLEEMAQEIKRGERDAARLLGKVRQVIGGERAVRLDYAEMVDAETFEPLGSLGKSCYVLIAAFVGGTRLIDNALIESRPDLLRVSL